MKIRLRKYSVKFFRPIIIVSMDIINFVRRPVYAIWIFQAYHTLLLKAIFSLSVWIPPPPSLLFEISKGWSAEAVFRA